MKKITKRSIEGIFAMISWFSLGWIMSNIGLKFVTLITAFGIIGLIVFSWFIKGDD